MQAFARFEDISKHKYDSMAYGKTRKTDSTVIEFIDKQGNMCFAKIIYFLKAGTNGICVCHLLDMAKPAKNPFSISSKKCLQAITEHKIEMRENQIEIVKDIVKRYDGKFVVKHQICVQPRLGKVILIDTQQIVRKCVFIDFSSDYWVVSKFPNIIEHN